MVSSTSRSRADPPFSDSPALPFSQRRVGHSDVTRLRATVDSLWENDDFEGGTERLEKLALFRSEQASSMLRAGGSRVASEIYAAAAEAMTCAAWCALEARDAKRAQRHSSRAFMLAGMSGVSAAVLSAWDTISIMSHRISRSADAKAAGRQVRATSLARRDPLYSSLSHVRTAMACSLVDERQAALRSLGYASAAFDRARPRERPRWLRFYDAAELEGLTGTVQLQLGRPVEAEYHLRRALFLIRPELRRNRAAYTIRLAMAQMWQDEPELACATVDGLKDDGRPTTARFEAEFGVLREGLAASGSSRARAWLDHHPFIPTSASTSAPNKGSA